MEPPNLLALTLLRVCNNVARNQHKTNPDKWARLATNKLTATNIANVDTLAINMGTLNTKLATATHSTFHKVTLQGFYTKLVTIDAITRDPSKVPYGKDVLALIPSPLRPLFRTITSFLDYTALEGPHTNN